MVADGASPGAFLHSKAFLVALNPLKPMPGLYSPETRLEYSSKNHVSEEQDQPHLAPHIYATAQRGLRGSLEDAQPHVIIVRYERSPNASPSMC
jgi:myosin heavy subunit